MSAIYALGMNQLKQLPVRESGAAFATAEFVYLAEMTDEDYALGFRYREIASPTAALPRRRVVAAVFFIDVSNRIVRVYDGAFHRPAWRAVQLTFPDARMALRSWQNGRNNLEFGADVLPYVEACLPTSEEY